MLVGEKPKPRLPAATGRLALTNTAAVAQPAADHHNIGRS